MQIRSRLLVVLAALLLVPAFTLPLWSIRIVAPQYNDGLGMYIGVSDIRGHTEHDIQNINILNHYIGMKPIVPAEVDVLQVMPWALAALVGAGLLVALLNRRWLVGAWLALFIVLGTAGMYEFWSWNYDYGHNLSPDAPLKVPGMTYTPPLIGAKTLLTIRATSYPSWGTLLIGLSFAAGLAALLLPRSAGRSAAAPGESRHGSRALRAAAAIVAVATVAVVAGCNAADQGGGQLVGARTAHAAVPEFAEGGTCDFCRGEIPAERFGGEVRTRSGVTYRFMSTECLAGFVAAGRVNADEIASMKVVDYNDGERLIDARSALYVRSEYRKSPSGLDLLATDSEKIAHNLHFFFGGTRLDWDQVLELVRKEWAL